MNARADDELLDDLLSGDRRALAAILHRYQNRVYQFIRWYIKVSAQTAEDLAQEVFLQIYRSAKSFRRRSSFRTWLYAVTRNVCLHHVRTSKAASR